MTDIIFSADGANELNMAVQKKLAPYLFLCCNYNPNQCVGLSDDGKYYPAILNLYNFSFDSSCIIRDLYRFQTKIAVDYKTRQNLISMLDIIAVLRAAIAHNNSEFNGFEETKNLEKYQQWTQAQIGKSAPDSPGDYVKLLDALSDMGKRLFAILDEYVEKASKHKERDKIVKEWKNKIIKWYCNNDGVKRGIFLGELENEFLARSQNTCSSANLKYNVACWVQEYYTKEIALERLKEFASKSKSTELRRLVEQREQEKEMVFSETEERFGVHYPYVFLDRLYSELPEMLRNTLDKTGCSMLPDDLLQRQIAELFKDVIMPQYH